MCDENNDDSIVKKEEKYHDLEFRFRQQHFKRLQNEYQESVETHETHMELLDLLRQINVYTANIAKTYLVATGKEEYVQMVD